VQQPVRRIGSLKVRVEFAGGSEISEADRVRLENAAKHCPVHQSLHPDVSAPIEFVYV